MSEIEANKILLGQVLSVCYAVDRNHITMKQKIDMLGFALNLHERAHGNKNHTRRSNECCWESPGYLPRLFPEVKKKMKAYFLPQYYFYSFSANAGFPEGEMDMI